MQELILNRQFQKLAFEVTSPLDPYMSRDGQMYSALGTGGALAGGYLANKINQATPAITGLRGTNSILGGAALGAGTAMAMKGINDYSKWLDEGKMTKKDLYSSAAGHGLAGALGGSFIGGGSLRSGLLGAGLGLGYKIYKDYKNHGR